MGRVEQAFEERNASIPVCLRCFRDLDRACGGTLGQFHVKREGEWCHMCQKYLGPWGDES